MKKLGPWAPDSGITPSYSEYTKGFLRSVQAKLSNEKFVAGAPEKVIEMERKKEADALAKIETIEQSLAGLK